MLCNCGASTAVRCAMLCNCGASATDSCAILCNALTRYVVLGLGFSIQVWHINRNRSVNADPTELAIVNLCTLQQWFRENGNLQRHTLEFLSIMEHNQPCNLRLPTGMCSTQATEFHVHPRYFRALWRFVQPASCLWHSHLGCQACYWDQELRSFFLYLEVELAGEFWFSLGFA